MAHLFRPVTVKPIPPNAEKCTKHKRPAVRWKNRRGDWTVALVTADGLRCRVESPYWWIEWHRRGLRQREKSSTNRDAATARMGEIVRDLQRERDGLAPLAKTVTAQTLHSLAKEYRDHLAALGRSEKHYEQTFTQITAIFEDRRWVRVQDVTLAGWSKWVGRQTEGDDGISAETVNHYLRALRGFFNWLASGPRPRLGADPLGAAKMLNADADRRIIRRTLTREEFRNLIDSTRKSKKVRLDLDGQARAALYLLASTTGLRAGELAGLCRHDLRTDAPTPFIVATAKRAKSRRAADIPIPAETIRELRTWLDRRTPDALLWPGNWHRDQSGGKMLRKDLLAAGIEPLTKDGSYDFHALRSQYGTDLARAGVPIQTAQQLLRHSTPALTAKFYTRLHLEDLAAAADRLGRTLGSNNPKYSEIPPNSTARKRPSKRQHSPKKTSKRGKTSE